MTPFPFTIRPATLADADLITTQRHAMFEAMGYQNRDELDRMDVHFKEWVMDDMRRGEYLGWFAVDASGQVAAGAGLWTINWPPHPLDARGRRAYLLNVYTAPAFRLQGLARRLTLTALDWCGEHGFTAVSLHASKEGRALYESLGFRQTNEMRLLLAEESIEIIRGGLRPDE